MMVKGYQRVARARRSRLASLSIGLFLGSALAIVSPSGEAAAQNSRRPALEPLIPGGRVPGGLKPPGDGSVKGRQASDLGMGGTNHLLSVKFGVTYHTLGRPEDLPGEPTLLSGTAFSGPGFVVGPSYEYVDLLPSLSMETGLLYTRSSATGFEERGISKREVLIESASLRVPVWLKLRFAPLKKVGLHFGLGAELLYGFSTGVTLREENVPLEESLDFEVAPVASFHLSGQFGFEFDLDKIRLPLSFHATFNPGAGSTTKERYVSYSDADPGPFRGEFDYELFFLLGLTLPL